MKKFSEERITAYPAFIEKVNAKGNFKSHCEEMAICLPALDNLRNGKAITNNTAQKIAEHYKTTYKKAFKIEITRSPLSGAYVNKVNTCLSAIFTALIKADVITKNPCKNSERPENSSKTGSYLDNRQIPLFLETLNHVDINSGVKMCILC